MRFDNFNNNKNSTKVSSNIVELQDTFDKVDKDIEFYK